jgi:ABC transport system ATP-binding/permease protein
MTANLRIIVQGRTQEFSPETMVVVGREPECSVVFDLDEVSRRHLGFWVEDGQWMLTHLSASNPTFVDGQRVERHPIVGPCSVRLSRVDVGPMFQVELVPTSDGKTRPANGEPKSESVSNASGSMKVGTKSRIGTFTEEFRPISRTIKIGRGDHNDMVLDNDLTVSTDHADLVTPDGISWEIVDRNSRNGTFVNGQRVSRAPIRADSVITIGRAKFQLDRGSLRRFESQGEVTFGASGITVLAPTGKDKGKVLLDNVSFRLPERCVLGVLGPSGSGKSTLVRALAGFRFADRGSVSINGEDLYTNYDAWRSRIGYVPQDDILHASLTVDKALKYAAKLRFEDRDTKGAVDNRITEVLAQLRLTEHRSKVISALSGGQRKRVSVALELLSKPDVIFLDEPTSGLDPGNEKSLMQELRALADDPEQGRTIGVITHSIQSLDLCDRLLILSRNGGLAFFGKPDEALAYFGATDYADVFDELERVDKATAVARFQASPQYREYVAPITAQAPLSSSGATRSKPVRQQPALRQFGTLTRRYFDVMKSDKRSLAGLLIQAPVIGAVLALLSKGGLRKNENLVNGKAGLTLLSLVLAASFLGASNAFREIVKERAIVRRERTFGLSIGAYLASKVVVLGMLTMLQGFLLVAIGTAASKGPAESVFKALPPKIELAISISLAGIAAMALGLMISAFVKNGDRAAAALPLLLLIMYLFSGGPSDPHNFPGVGEVSYLNSAKWGMSAAAATADLQELNKCKNGRSAAIQGQLDLGAKVTGGLDPREEPSQKEYDDLCKNLWTHTSQKLLADYLALVLMAVVLLGFSGYFLTRLRD